MMILGALSIIIGLILLGMAGYAYYEEKENKPIPVGIEGLFYKYRMWLAIAGVVLLLIGGAVVWSEQDKMPVIFS